MVKSMTGYGRARQERNGRSITVEVRSVNNRYLDCTVKMPRMYGFAEDAVKQHVQKAVSRGKVDVFITVDASAADVAKVTVNRELAAQYAAREWGADVLLFGHTHCPLVDWDGALYTMNPGAAGDPRRPTYGVITMENGKVDCATFLL